MISGWLPVVLANSFQEEVLGRKVERPETVAAQMTLSEVGAGLDTQLILAVLLFKLHYHDQRKV